MRQVRFTAMLVGVRGRTALSLCCGPDTHSNGAVSDSFVLGRKQHQLLEDPVRTAQ